jgi:hypothetical protein
MNQHFSELADLFPGCDARNKGDILQRAVEYIKQLKENEEKRTREKLPSEQAIQHLSQRNDKLEKDLERALWAAENLTENLKKACLKAKD